jgi:hypothetical protein
MIQSEQCSHCSRPLAGPALSGLCTVCEQSEAAVSSVPIARVPRHGENTVTAVLDRQPATAGRQREETALPVVPGFTLLETLGAGGMGLVFRAWESAAERIVALKLVRVASDPDARERFKVEAKSLARIQHPNIVQVFTVELDSREPYFTMEYVEGQNLEARLKANGPMPPEEAAGVMETVARAVAAAHAAGVIHRDLKPSNILLSTDGVPKVTDFGLAKRLDTADGLTVTDVMLGTPGYMAPEQAGRRNAEIGPLSDVYSLGATLYALLSGRAPFRGTTPLETAQQVLTLPPTPPGRLRPDVPPDLEAVVLKCLEKSPARRYASAGALADDLARWGRSEPTVARPLSRWAKARRALRRRAKPIAAVALLLAGLIGLAWLAPAGRAPDPIRQAQRDLSLGKPVTLIGETGLPRYPHRWALGPTALGDSPLGDKSCYFEAIGTSLLELFPAPQVDRYRVTADLRIMQTMLIPPEANDPAAGVSNTQLVGLYFGHAELPSADGMSAHAFLTLAYNDILSADVQDKLLKRDATPRSSAWVISGMMTRRPDRLPIRFLGGGSRAITFAPQRTFPCPWRRVCVEVTPGGVRAYWAFDPEEELRLVDTLAPDRLGAMLTSPLTKPYFTQTHPEAAPTAPPSWQPRMPVGVWCSEGAVAVKNVVIEAIP